jgi:hypothetical protein
MANFEVFSDATFVGTSSLENGDPPMGVAFGRFFPAETYAIIQAQCINNHADQSSLKLTVRTPTGQVIQCAGVGILDYSPEVGVEGIEVNVLGISHPSYEDLFPQHVAQYEQQFK